jgi:pyruvate,orthophosphate dikinase
VRSGAAVSMPGMMDTVLNLGLTEEVAEGLAKMVGNRRFALDARRRFIQMFANVVEGLPLRRERAGSPEGFEDVLRAARIAAGVMDDTDLDEAALESVVARYLELFQEQTGRPFPQDPTEQLERSIAAVFGSWMGNRACEYRRIHKIGDLLGTAVNVQSMVFGNLSEDSGTGVCFTRDPATGQNIFYGDFLMNAQGEDVVAGIRLTEPLADLEKRSPASYRQLVKVRRLLERHYGDIQDIEFTIERGTLYILQTRNGKTTAKAAIRIAVEMANERIITREEAVARITPEQVDQLLHPTFDPTAERRVIAKGLPASPGAVTGSVVFTAEEAKEKAAEGARLVLVREETSPEDVGGMYAAEGVLTATGGLTSHAAVVARGMGKCCVVGAGSVRIDMDERCFRVGDVTVREGDMISLDGTTGQVMLGAVTTMDPEPSAEFATLLSWADKIRELRVRANADAPEDAQTARDFGAQGIGLCRTEHMFFGGDRIAAMREMILAQDLEGRRVALEKLLPFQRSDFQGILTAMSGLPVTIRLLDPPLHEFLPHDAEQAQEVATALDVPVAELLDRAARLKEQNPMLGHRGCRLGITYPEIYEMQVRAIFEAAADAKAAGAKPMPEVMIPLVGAERELEVLKERLVAVAKQALRERKARVPVIFGTMIEIPRAALRAGDIANQAEFFSFGTNDLTQLTFGFSRDDVSSFLPQYVAEKILPDEPFQTLDQSGVGELITIAVERGRKTRPGLKVGICGEHGGDPASIDFCHRTGLDYVSCSPYRVPVARLAAAQATIRAAAPTAPTKANAKPKAKPKPKSKAEKVARKKPTAKKKGARKQVAKKKGAKKKATRKKVTKKAPKRKPTARKKVAKKKAVKKKPARARRRR